ncbi:substrate-binding periplasmic protein [Roseibium sp.]|uniref:substrate-binding periplasmic protein n=1 Tax=Roseibium sp. TaxID=1936156 RepID=UPI003D0EF9FB
MKIRSLKNFVFFIVLALLTLPAKADHITIVTEHLPPYNYLEDGEAQGMSTEVVQAALEAAGHTYEIRFMPWARAYQIALTKPNTLVYSIARTNEREALFAWVGEIAPFGAALYQRADQPAVKLQQLRDARLLQVGVYRGDAKEAILRKNGFQNLQTTEDDLLNLRKLLLGRIDLIAIDDSVIGPLLKEEGIAPDKVRRVLGIEEISGNLYMAFHKETDPGLVSSVQRGLEVIKENGEYEQILNRYLLIN